MGCGHVHSLQDAVWGLIPLSGIHPSSSYCLLRLPFVCVCLVDQFGCALLWFEATHQVRCLWDLLEGTPVQAQVSHSI